MVRLPSRVSACVAGCPDLTCSRTLPACLLACLPGCPQDDAERDVEVWLRRKFEGRIREVEVVMREDLDLVRPV
jgi:hypothetical protein